MGSFSKLPKKMNPTFKNLKKISTGHEWASKNLRLKTKMDGFEGIKPGLRDCLVHSKKFSRPDLIDIFILVPASYKINIFNGQFNNHLLGTKSKEKTLKTTEANVINIYGHNFME
jgi:hypothetical protein